MRIPAAAGKKHGKKFFLLWRILDLGHAKLLPQRHIIRSQKQLCLIAIDLLIGKPGVIRIIINQRIHRENLLKTIVDAGRFHKFPKLLEISGCHLIGIHQKGSDSCKLHNLPQYRQFFLHMIPPRMQADMLHLSPGKHVVRLPVRRDKQYLPAHFYNLLRYGNAAHHMPSSHRLVGVRANTDYRLFFI